MRRKCQAETNTCIVSSLCAVCASKTVQHLFFSGRCWHMSNTLTFLLEWLIRREQQVRKMRGEERSGRSIFQLFKILRPARLLGVCFLKRAVTALLLSGCYSYRRHPYCCNLYAALASSTEKSEWGHWGWEWTWVRPPQLAAQPAPLRFSLHQCIRGAGTWGFSICLEGHCFVLLSSLVSQDLCLSSSGRCWYHAPGWPLGSRSGVLSSFPLESPLHTVKTLLLLSPLLVFALSYLEEDRMAGLAKSDMKQESIGGNWMWPCLEPRPRPFLMGPAQAASLCPF